MAKHKSLAELAKSNPQPQPPEREAQAAAEAYRIKEEATLATQRTEELKADILTQIETGEPLQVITLNAIEVIGILSQAPGWTEAARQAINENYKDLEQQTILTNRKAEALQKLDSRKDRSEKMRRQLQNSLTTCRQIDRALTDAIYKINELEDFIEGADLPGRPPR